MRMHVGFSPAQLHASVAVCPADCLYRGVLLEAHLWLHDFVTLHLCIDHLRFHEALSHVCRMGSVRRRGWLADGTERNSQTTAADVEAAPLEPGRCLQRSDVKSISLSYFLCTRLARPRSHPQEMAPLALCLRPPLNIWLALKPGNEANLERKGPSW